MSSNAGAKKQLIQKFGKICMVEEAGIRKIPVAIRKKIKGYKKSDDMLTYHHLNPKRKGGKSTFENGALVKDYNHRWLESLPADEREEVNNRLREFKLNFSTMAITGKGVEVINSGSIPLEFERENEDDEIIIPVFDTIEEDKKKKMKHKSRAQIKREMQRQIDEDMYFYGEDDLEK